MTGEKEVATENNGQEKTEDNTEDETELESSIIRQVEYYFGDINLCRDKFLREQVGLDEGWVPLDVLIRFNRLAKMSKDQDVILTALNKSTSGILEISMENKKVRRHPEMPVPEMNEDRRKELQSRTVYAKGFHKDTVLDEVLDYFKKHGGMENLVMRKYVDKVNKKRLFKGSVFATFNTKNEAEKFMKAKEVKYGETVLERMWQEEYLQKKQKEYEQKKEKKDKKHKEVKETPRFQLPKGTVFHFSQGHDTMSREDVKNALVAIGADEISYIEFKQGETEGYARLAKENAAKELTEKITDGKLKIGDSEVVFRLLEGDEETTYLEKTVEHMSRRRKNQKTFNKQNKGKHYKGRQGRKRKHDNNGDEPPRKIKTDS